MCVGMTQTCPNPAGGVNVFHPVTHLSHATLVPGELKSTHVEYSFILGQGWLCVSVLDPHCKHSSGRLFKKIYLLLLYIDITGSHEMA